MKLVKTIESDNNVLFIFKTCDGYFIESVLAKKPMCLCISTHIGCDVGCVFCASCKMGCVRSLKADELVTQVKEVYNKYKMIKDVHFGGIGEPLYNLQNIFLSMEQLSSKTSTFSITTSMPTIDKFQSIVNSNFNSITISLHSMRNDIRKKIIPKSIDVSVILSNLKHIVTKSNGLNERITLGYIMLSDINDSDEEIKEFIDFTKELDVTLFPMFYNKISDNELLFTNSIKYNQTLDLLKEHGIKFAKSSSSRKDSIGGCGTLMVNRGIKEICL